MDVPLHIAVFRDAESWVRQQLTEQGITGIELERQVQEEVEFWSGAAGAAGTAGFVVNTFNSGHTEDIQRVAIHELTHVFQYQAL